MKKALLLLLLASFLVAGCISVETRDEVFINAENARISIGFKLLRGSTMATPIPLSSSIGGDRVLLDSTDLPGKLIHQNPADSGENHIVTDILVVNPNSNTITLWATVQRPGIAVPTEKNQDQMVRIDIPPTAEGNEPRLFYTPFILAPGFSYHITCTNPDNPGTVYLIGFVETFPAAGVLGYGGLIRRADSTAVASISAGTWITLDYEAGLVTDPVNLVQEPGNNRISLGAPGLWFVTAYGTFTADKDASNDRSIFTRFYNETDGAPITQQPFPAYIENNSNNALWSYTSLFEVPQSLVGKYLRQEFGGSASAFSNVIFHKLGQSFIRIAPILGA